MVRIAWKRGNRIFVLALCVALGVHATFPRAAAARQAARGAAPSQSRDQGLTDPALVGALDVHAHMGPDSPEPSPRALDVLDYAKMAKARGMRGFVIKYHSDETAPLAYLARKVVPGLEVFGGIVLQRAIGGINAEEVRHMAKVKGGWGRIVWMPTFDAEDVVRNSKEPDRPFVAVTRNGQVLPEVKEVLGVIATTRTVDSDGELVLATGHLPPEEALMVLREARNQGVKHMVLTHAPPRWTLDQLREAIKLGAFIEAVPGGGGFDPKKIAIDRIRTLGVENYIISSDLGQEGNPFHPDGLALTAKWMRSERFTEQELNRMMKENPARLLGLPPPQ